MTQQVVTAEELLDLPDDGRSCELVNGELRATPLGNFEHGRAAATIGCLISGHVGRNDVGGVLAAKTGVAPAHSPGTARAPDAALGAWTPCTQQSRQIRRGDGAIAVQVLRAAAAGTPRTE